MHIIDRIKRDIDTISKIDDKKEKYIYLWDYYKLPIVSVAIAVVVLLVALLSTLGKESKILYVVLLNNDSSVVEVDESVFINELNKAGVNIENKTVDVNAYLSLGNDNSQDGETLQVLNALFSLTDLDVYVSPKEQFDIFGEKDAFCDLSLLIDKELLNNHRDDLYIYKDTNNKNVVGGIVLHDNSIIHKAGYYHNDVIIGVANNGVNLENAIILIKEMLSD